MRNGNTTPDIKKMIRSLEASDRMRLDKFCQQETKSAAEAVIFLISEGIKNLKD